MAALGRVHGDGVGVDSLADERLHLLAADDLFEHGAVSGDEDQAVHGVLLEPEPAVAGHRLGDVDEERVRDCVAAVLEQDVDDLLGVMPGGAGVPEAQRRQPVGVHMFGGALELGERCDGPTAVLGAVMVDLEQEGLVGLDDRAGHRSHAIVAQQGKWDDRARQASERTASI